MATADSTDRVVINKSIDTSDALTEASKMLSFLQEAFMASDDGIADEGLTFIIFDIQSRIKKGVDYIDEMRTRDKSNVSDSEKSELPNKLSDLSGFVNEKLLTVGYALAGIRDEASHSTIEPEMILLIENLLYDAKKDIRDWIEEVKHYAPA